MRTLGHLLLPLFIVMGLVAPLVAGAIGTSFGGHIVAWVPCLSASGPSIWITIKPAGVFPITYIWAPGTLGLPPTHIGQQILGIADVPYACFVGKFPFFGQRIQADAVSL